MGLIIRLHSVKAVLFRGSSSFGGGCSCVNFDVVFLEEELVLLEVLMIENMIFLAVDRDMMKLCDFFGSFYLLSISPQKFEVREIIQIDFVNDVV